MQLTLPSKDYSQRLGDELEAEILRLGAGTVCAFFAETGRDTLSIHSLCY